MHAGMRLVQSVCKGKRSIAGGMLNLYIACIDIQAICIALSVSVCRSWTSGMINLYIAYTVGNRV